MKIFSLFLMTSLLTTSLFAGTCSKVAENIFSDEGMQTERPALFFKMGICNNIPLEQIFMADKQSTLLPLPVTAKLLKLKRCGLNKS